MAKEKVAFELRILGGIGRLDPLDDNVDVEISFPDDERRFSATFFTRRNIDSLIEKNKTTGECASGLYFWGSNLIIVSSLSRETIEATVQDLLTTGEFDRAFGLLDEDE